MFLRRKLLAVGVSASVLLVLLLGALPAFAAVTVQLISVSKPSNLPADCGGTVNVTFSYVSDEDFLIEYTITINGNPITGAVPIFNTFGQVITQTVPFNLPVIPKHTAITANIAAKDFLNQTITLNASAATYYCENGYPLPGTPPAPTTPDVIVIPPPTDGRLDISTVHGVIYYDGDGVFSVYTLDENSNGVLAIQFTEAEKDALPDFPATNILIEQNADGTVSLYKLTTGEYQLNLGPDFEGKVRVFIFDDFPPTHVYSSEFVVGP